MSRLYKRYYYHNSTKLRRRGLVSIGQLVNVDGEIWAVTGYDDDYSQSRRAVVWIAKNATVRECTAHELGMEWDQ